MNTALLKGRSCEDSIKLQVAGEREKVTASGLAPPPRFLVRHRLEGFDCLFAHHRDANVDAAFLAEPAPSPSVIAKEFCTPCSLECRESSWKDSRMGIFRMHCVQQGYHWISCALNRIRHSPEPYHIYSRQEVEHGRPES